VNCSIRVSSEPLESWVVPTANTASAPSEVIPLSLLPSLAEFGAVTRDHAPPVECRMMGSSLFSLSMLPTHPLAHRLVALTAVTAVSSSMGFEPAFISRARNFREDAFLLVSAEFGGPGSAGSGYSGRNLVPTLHWYDVPAGTKSSAFTITDVDAPLADSSQCLLRQDRDVDVLLGNVHFCWDVPLKPGRLG
jgi:hypothetical protein